MSCPSKCECQQCCPECSEFVGDDGCKSITPLGCTNYGGEEFECLDITNADTGNSAIEKMAQAICALNDDVLNPEDRDRMVRISVNDTTSGFLQQKLVAGAGIKLTKNNSHLNEIFTVSINPSTFPSDSGLNVPLVVTSGDNSIKVEQSGTLDHTVDLRVNFGGEDGLPEANCDENDVCECEPDVFVCVGPNGLIFNETTFSAIAGNGIKIIPGGVKGHAPTFSIDFRNSDNPDGPPDAECNEDGEDCHCPEGVLVCLDADGNPIFEMPNLQEVTDVGNVTTNAIQASGFGVGVMPTEPLQLSKDGGWMEFNGNQLFFHDSLGNMWMGYRAGLEHKAGADNIAIGSSSQIGSGVNGQGGSNRISIGQASAMTLIGDNGVYIGRYSGLGTDGNNNTMVGHLSGSTTFTNNSTLIGTNTSAGEVAAEGSISNANFIPGTNDISGMGALLDEAGFTNIGERIVVEISNTAVHIGGAPLFNNAGQFKAVVGSDGDTIEMLYNGEFSASPAGMTTIKIFKKTTNAVVIGNNGHADRNHQVVLGDNQITQLRINNVRFNTSISPTATQIPIWDAVNGEYRPGSLPSGVPQVALTTNGTSGVATYNVETGALNIPNYTHTETDPYFKQHVAHSITNQNKTDWTTAFEWGNHAIQGYITLNDLSLTTEGDSGPATYDEETGVFNIPVYEGEANTASNIGNTTNGLFASKEDIDLRFKSLIAGEGITITPSATDVTISAPSSYKVKVDDADTPDFLENQIEKGDDPLGLVSITITKVNGKLRITPTINIPALCTALQNHGCVCGDAEDVNVTNL